MSRKEFVDYPDYKQINADNWLKPDLPTTHYLSIDKDSIGERMMGEHWLKDINQYKADPNVPDEIRVLLDVARGAFIYGFFYYPLYTLGAEQVYRVGEAAISARHVALDGPSQNKNFNDKIEWLHVNGHMDNDDKNYWHAIRGLRNDASHPKQQQNLTPPMAVAMLRDITFSINSLFAEPTTDTEDDGGS